MKIPRFGLLIFILLNTALLSCRAIKEPNFLNIENLRLGQLGLNESTMSLDLRYFNPNNSRIKLKEAEGDAYLDGVLLGHFTIDTLIHIPANGEFILPVKLAVDMKYALKNALTTFFSNEVVIKIDGKAKVGKGAIFIHYPIRYEGKQNLSSLLK